MHKTYPEVVTSISFKQSHESTVSTMSGYKLDRQGINIQLSAGTRNFSPLQTAKVHPTSSSVGTVGCFPCGKASGVSGYYSPLSSTEVKNEWSYNSGPTYAFIPCKGATLFCLIINSLTLISAPDKSSLDIISSVRFTS